MNIRVCPDVKVPSTQVVAFTCLSCGTLTSCDSCDAGQSGAACASSATCINM